MQHIDTGRATALSGVRAVVTGQDLPTLNPGIAGPAGSVTVNEYDLVCLGMGALIVDDTVVPKPFATAMEGLDLPQPSVQAGVWLVIGPADLDGWKHTNAAGYTAVALGIPCIPTKGSRMVKPSLAYNDSERLC